MELNSKNHLNGKRLYYSFLSGAFNVFENQKMLNKINVFPVPDADTGTNLASTFRSIVENASPSHSVKHTSVAIAEAALTGARGNSGIIIAQFLYGFSNEIEDSEYISLQTFAEVMRKAVDYAYQAISNPIEGTIITVLREWAEFIYMLRDKFESFEQLMIESLIKAQESLERTPEKLLALKKANVVDAGAKGFVVFLEGIAQFFQTNHAKKVLSYKTLKLEYDDTVLIDSHEESAYRYCTEAMISLKNITKIQLGEFLNTQGDSLVMAGPESKMRIHIHTNEPAAVFAHLADNCTILYQKVDDMVRQRDVAHHRKNKIALVIDSTCDIPVEYIEKHQMQVVPLNVFFGESQFLDRLTITQDKFFDLLQTSETYPTSAQPGIKDITNTFSFLSTHYESIISLHISALLSGTFANSSKAAEAMSKETGKRIDVVNSRLTSGAMGLVALRIAHAIEDGMSQDEILAQVDTWISNTKIFVGAQSLKSFIKGGRVSPAKGFIGNLLNTKPIISITPEGKADLFDKAFSHKSSLKKIMGHFEKFTQGKQIWKYCITHAQNPELANLYANQIEKLTGQKPEYIMGVSPVLAISAGMGTVTVSVMTQ